jgi:predicted TIM-barrel fold metal-dependent hydrolase
MLSTFNISDAVRELERCKEAGLLGAMVWEVPPPDLTFDTAHYDPLWEAAQDLGVPISLHILTGATYTWPKPRPERHLLLNSARHANNLVHEASNAVSDLIVSGVFERFPALRFVLVESEASWIPFLLSRYDNYGSRANMESALAMAPSAYFSRNFAATFFNDPVLASVLAMWGTHNCMWSNDYPHPNSTWPNSRAVIERDLGNLPAEDRQRLLSGNVVELYGLPVLAPTLG